MLKSINRLLAVLLIQLICVSPFVAQQKRRTPAPRRTPPAEPVEPAPTFDSLLAARSYKVYSEVRNVGGLIHSPAVTELLDALVKVGTPPQEVTTLLPWLKTHADSLVGSRLMSASAPSRQYLPQVLVAVEFSSAEDAKKFHSDLKGVLPKVFPTPDPPSTSGSPATSSPDGTTTRGAQQVMSRADPDTPAADLPYRLKQVGSLVLISSTTVDLRVLRPRGSPALEEDTNFATARNRFASEPVFVFLDLKAMEEEENAQRRRWQEQEIERQKAAAANPPKIEAEPSATPPDEPLPPPPPAAPEVIPETATVELKPEEPQRTGTLGAGPPPGALPSLSLLWNGLFSGPAKWPDALGAALVLDGDAYVVRTLVINKTDDKNSVLPFIPQLVSGPAITPAAANVFPANTDLFVSLSLDYPRMYEELSKSSAKSDERARLGSGLPPREGLPENPFAGYEKRIGLTVKDDLLPLLGNEIALALPRRPAKVPSEVASPSPPDVQARPTRLPEPTPVIAVAIKDREAVKRFIQRLLEGLGMKAANLIAQTEKRDATELVSYAGAFAYAFVEDFLIISTDAAETRRVVDAYLSHQTLASDNSYKNFTRWQPRQVSGQVYVGQGLVETYFFGSSAGVVNERITELFNGISPVIDPMTYALSVDGSDTMHELHVPKNLVQFLLAGAAASSSRSSSPLQNNENMARNALYSIAYAQQSTKSDSGGYVTLDELITKGFVSREMIENNGYTIVVSPSGNSFEAIAVPVEYGKTGRRSFFIDESMIMRGGDHGGGAATASDNPL